MKRRFTIVAALALLVFMMPSLAGWGQTRSVATLNIQNYAQANSWSNGTKYTTATVSPVTFTANGSSNTGKYYTNGQEWRYYQSESASITVSVSSDYTLSSITFTYNISNGGVLKDGTNTVSSGTAVSVSGTSATFTVGNSGSATNGQVKFTNIVVNYVAAGGNPIVATPTFTPAAGTYTQAQNVSISCATEGATIYYTTNGNDPTTNSSVYSSAIPVSSTTTIKAMAVKSGYDNSSIASATYTIVNLEHAGTEADPYTVADARAAIDANVGVTGVYVEGIVSIIVTAYNSSYGNITFDMIDEAGATVSLRAYRCGGDDAADVAVEDIALVYGNLIKFNNTTYELAEGCQLVSLTHPAVAVEAPTFSLAEGGYATAQTVTLSCATTGATIKYTTDGTDPATSGTSQPYSTAIAVNQTMTIKAVAVSGEATSSLATANYYIKAASNTHTVDQALAFPEYPQTNIFVSGIVCTAPTAAPNNGTLIYYISEDGTTDARLEVYKGKNLNNTNFTEQTDIQVGDLVTVFGNVKVYSSQTEFDQGNYLVEFERPTTITAADVEIAYNDEEGVISYTINNPVTGGSIVASTNDDWLIVDNDSQTTSSGTIEFVCDPNSSNTARTATVTLTYTFNTNETVTKDITITQTAAPAPVINANDVVITCDATSGSISYTIENEPSPAGTLTATLVAGYTISNLTINQPANGGISFTCDANGTTTARTAEVTLAYSYGNNEQTTKTITITQAAYVVDYATLPFEYNGGELADFSALTGTSYDLSDVGSYAAVNAPYRIKFTATGDYLQVKTNGRPGIVTIGVKVFNTGTNSKITVQGSADGTTFTNVQELTISASTTGTSTITTTNSFEENYRYVRLYFTKGVNVGVGPISIAAYVAPGNTAPVWSELPTPTIAVNEEYELDLSTLVTGTPSPAITLATSVSNSLYEFENGLLVFQPTAAGTYEFTFTATNSEGSANATLTVTAAEVATYTLATSITSGRHYVIAATTSTTTMAMGGKNASKDYYDAIAATLNGNTITVMPNSGIQEFVIVGPNVDGNYYIYDPVAGGYLYASSSGSNDLSYQTPNDANGLWEIDFTNSTVTAQGANTHNLLRYNSGSPRFSCYTSGQTAIAFYEKNETTPQYDFYKDIAKYTVATTSGEDKADGWYLIATPVVAGSTPSDCGLITDDLLNNGPADNYTYDFYAWDNSENLEWRNYRSEQFILIPGKGYLYANKNDVTLHFSGTAYSDNGQVGLTTGWNLIGNPFAQTASLTNASNQAQSFYRMNAAGTELESATGTIAAMEGVFVQAENNNDKVTFAPTSAVNSGSSNNTNTLNVNLSQVVATRGGSQSGVIDRAIVRFDEGNTLEKFMLNPENTKLYIPQDGKDYAVVNAQAQGEMPVNFKASKNGEYTLSVEAQNLQVNYLHLIDNKTGMDVDLLANPSYTFEANRGDNANRFRLVFDANAIDENASTSSASFAYYNGSSWVVSNMGEATLQVVDVMGRVLRSETINGNAELSINEVPGVYMLRLVNGNNVMVQKVIVK